MIRTKQDLKRVINMERMLYQRSKRKDNIVDFITCEPRTKIWKYQKLLRKTEYYYNNKQKSPVYGLLYLLYRHLKNRRGLRLGIEIWENSFDEGLEIFHAGNIVINGNARIGKNCKLHGDNCIGNLGTSLDTPVIGDNVDIGVGAKIIGGITLANDIKIGAGAVVVKSCMENKATLVGIPAKVIRK